ncbi:MAG: SulP family inorganic anion transporter [Polyangiaceae bacterium]
MQHAILSLRGLRRDIPAGIVVSLVALPLCLGIALASNAPLSSGLIAGIVGGLVVGLLSGSHTSVSGPAAGLTAVVAAQIAALGSFSNFLVAVFAAGVIQVGLGLARAGNIAAFMPSSVIKGLLAAIGITLILKQVPHLVGHDPDPVGELSFAQPDGKNTFSELLAILDDFQLGAAFIGLVSLGILIAFAKLPRLKRSPVPAPLLVVLVAVGLNQVLGGWTVQASHLVQVPLADEGFRALLSFPDWAEAVKQPGIITAAVTIAMVASLETLLNLEAVDKLDPQQRESPPNRELLAQGVGNMTCGLLGGLPVTSVVVRGSVNLGANNNSKLSALTHGALLLAAVLLAPQIINLIPLSALAAILVVTGFKLASPRLFQQLYKEGKRQFLPFVTTVAAIVLIDLLWGVVIGLMVSLGFILHAQMKRPLRRVREHHIQGDVMRIELATQVGFFSRPALERALLETGEGQHVLIDARGSGYIDADVLDFLQDFQTVVAPARGIQVSTLGLKEHYADLEDRVVFVDYASRELQNGVTPEVALEVLREGNRRFLRGETLGRDLLRQVEATAPSQSPLAVVLSCIDSRAPTEILFDQGIGDIFTIRVAGNVAKDKVFASMEYGCVVAGAKLVLVLGHTSCGAVTAAVSLLGETRPAAEVTGCDHISALIDEIHEAVPDGAVVPTDPDEKAAFVEQITRANVERTIDRIRNESRAMRKLEREGKVAIVGGIYDVHSGEVEFFEHRQQPAPVAQAS